MRIIGRVIRYKTKRVKIRELAFFGGKYWVELLEPHGKYPKGSQLLVNVNTVERALGLPLSTTTSYTPPKSIYLAAMRVNDGTLNLIGGKPLTQKYATIVAQANSKTRYRILKIVGGA